MHKAPGIARDDRIEAVKSTKYTGSFDIRIQREIQMNNILIRLEDQSLEHKRLLIIVLVCFSLFLSTSLFYQSRLVVTSSDTSDFSAYYSAYMIERELGTSIYDRDGFLNTSRHESVKGDTREYLYTPLLAEAMSLFMPNDYTTARLVWLVIEHAALFSIFIISGLLAITSLNAAPLHSFTLSALVIIGFSAVERSLFYGQATLVMVALVYFSVLMRELNRPYIAGFVAALATILKLYPIVYLVALIIKGRYIESLAFLGFLVLIVLAFIMIFGPEDWIHFIQFENSPLTSRIGADVTSMTYEEPNYSIYALISLLADQYSWSISRPEIWKWIKVVIAGSALTVLVLFFNRIRYKMSFLHLVTLGFTGILLLSPLGWNHLYILLIPTFIALGYQLVFDAKTSNYMFFTLLVSFVLVGFPDILINMPFTNNGMLVALKFTKLYGLLILIMLMIVYPPPNDAKAPASEPFASP